MVTNPDKLPADRIKGTALSLRVSGGAVEPPRLTGLDHRFEHAILRLKDVGAAETSQRTKPAVAVPPRQLDGLVQMMVGAVDVAEEESQPAELLAGHHEASEVVQPRGDHQRGFLRRGEPLPARLAPEIPPGGPGQFPGVRSVAALGGLPDHAKQDMLFVLEPLGRLGGSREFLKRDTRPRRGPGDLGLAVIENRRGHGGSPRVVFKHAVRHIPPAGLVLPREHLLHRVGAQQVVTAVAAGNVLREQVLLAQLRHRQVRLSRRQPGHARRRRHRDIRSRVNAKQPEHARCRAAQPSPRP